MICSSCGTPNEPGARFCIQCGAAQAQACPACGHGNPPGANFCSNCGSALASEAEAGQAQPAPAPSIVAERRLVTVLFVDLVGFTTLSEDRDPEDTRELLSRYFDVARGVVERHGGTVEKFIGDAVMAVWGAPVAHEDDAERAVRAALELLAAVDGVADGEEKLTARAGVLTGEAAVTVGAEGQGMVAGDLVNTASRLQSVAEPGTVLVGEATYRAAAQAVRFEPAGEKALKGKAEPVPTWRAAEVVSLRRGGRRVATLEPPFVGREDELRQIKDLFETTSRERKPRLVSIIGQAGIGKSRLAWEFEKYLDGVVEEVYWHEGRSPAYGEGISYWALAEMIRRRAAIADGDEPSIARGKLAELLERTISDASERRWVEQRLAGLLGIAELPTEGREELFAAWRTFFERNAEQAPSVLVFADLHWADQGLLDFIEYMLSWSRSSPLFVLVLARPELLERRPEWGTQVRSVTRINLEPLADDQMARLLEGTLPGLDLAVVRRIVDRAEGIPLYAVETARMLLDTGTVVERDGRYEVVGEVSQLAVAETLQALIAARLDATAPDERSLLQDAAVLGQSFATEALAAVSGTPPEQLEAPLERLARRQLLVQDVDPRSPERGNFRFVQSLIREVAYQSLARADRRARHLAAARYFETVDDEELAGVLATHYLEAYRASRPGPEAEALAAQARIALSAAAERAAALHSHKQAVSYLERAISVAEDPAEQAALHLRATESGEYAADPAGAMEHARAAAELFRQLGDPRGQLAAAGWLGRHQILFRVEEDAIESLRRAIAEAEPLGDVPELAACLSELSRALMLSEHRAEAVQTSDRALAVAGKHELVGATVEALINRGSSLGPLLRRHEAEAVLRGAAALADRHGLVAASLRARNNLASNRFTDNVEELAAFYVEAKELATRYGHRPFFYQFVYQLADLDFRAGRWDEMTVEMDEIEQTEKVYEFYLAGFDGVRALLAAARGRHAEADALMRRATEATASMRSPMIDSWLHLTRGQLALYRADWKSAAEFASQALDNRNTDVDGAEVLVHAAAAGNLPEQLDRAVAGLGPSATYPELVSRFNVAAGRAAMAARAGNWEEARAGYATAKRGLEDAGHLTTWALFSLEWGALGAERMREAAEALEAGMTYFAERGGETMARGYVDAVVPVDAGGPTPGTAKERTGASTPG